MKGVLTLFGEVDKQELLKKVFIKNNLMFVCKNAETSVQLIGFVEEHLSETDAVIIDVGAVRIETIFELLDTIIALKSSIRIVLILNGGRSQYQKTQLTGFRQRHIDIIFDEKGFDLEILVRFLNKGPVKQFKAENDKPTVPTEKAENKNTDAEEISVKDMFSGKIVSQPVDGNVSDSDIQEQDEDLPETFSQFRGHYSIGIMGASHGVGATSLAVKLGQYFALHNCSVALVDYTGTDALSLAKCKAVDYVFESQSMRQLKKKYNIVVIDFGAPFYITPKGDSFKLESDYPVLNMPEFNKCNIKIVMGFSDSWNVRKIRHFLENEQWKKEINSSYIFLVADKAYKLRRIYPSVNILDRDENVADEIYELIKQEEVK